MPDDRPVIAERAFVLDWPTPGEGEREMRRWVDRWEAYPRVPDYLREAQFGYEMRPGAKHPSDGRVEVKAHKRKVRAEHRTYRIGVVIVRDASEAP